MSKNWKKKNQQLTRHNARTQELNWFFFSFVKPSARVTKMRRQSSVAENVATVITAFKNGKVVETPSFDQLLLNSIDEALTSLFNRSAIRSIYFYVEKICHLSLDEIPKKPDVFSGSLHQLLGAGALVIEEGVLKTLYSKLKLQLAEEESYTFADYIDELRKKYASS